jgi:hypothetical protein
MKTVPGPMCMDFRRLSAFPTENVFVVDGIRSPLKMMDVPVAERVAFPIWMEPVET